MHVVVYSRRHISSFEAIHLSPRHANAWSVTARRARRRTRRNLAMTSAIHRAKCADGKGTSRRRQGGGGGGGGKGILPQPPRNIFKDEQAIYITRVARLIKRSQSKPKLIAAAARTACPGMGRARCAKSAVISASESASRAQVGHCTAVHRPDRRMRPERRRIGGAFQATIDPLYRQCGGHRRLRPGGLSAVSAVLLLGFRFSS